jgi:hypothetical protein
MRREGATEGSTELYTASLGNTWRRSSLWEAFCIKDGDITIKYLIARSKLNNQFIF